MVRHPRDVVAPIAVYSEGAVPQPVCVDPSARKVAPYPGLIISRFRTPGPGIAESTAVSEYRRASGVFRNEVPNAKIKIVLSVLKVMAERTNRPRAWPTREAKL